MRYSRVCELNGKRYTRELEVDREKFEAYIATPRHLRGLIQNVFPELSADDREFILTGTPPEVWEEIFARSE